MVQVNQSKLGTICLSTQWKVRINPIVFLLLNFFRKILTFWTLYVYFSEHLFNLKFAVKDLERSAKKCEKDEKLEIAKTKKAIQKGNTEVRRHIQELILYGICYLTLVSNSSSLNYIFRSLEFTLKMPLDKRVKHLIT